MSPLKISFLNVSINANQPFHYISHKNFIASCPIIPQGSDPPPLPNHGNKKAYILCFTIHLKQVYTSINKMVKL